MLIAAMDGEAIVIGKVGSHKIRQRDYAMERNSPIWGLTSATASMKGQMSGFTVNLNTCRSIALTLPLCSVTGVV